MYSVVLTAVVLASAPTVDVLSTPLSKGQILQGRSYLARMKTRDRGPYTSVAWFCEDGAVLPPKAYACKDHGGGIQHGVPSAMSRWLADRGVYVGTVLASLVSGDLISENFYRARALLVERYLERSEHGWVMRRARTMRGVKQIEDEERASALLIGALAASNDAWLHHRSLLVRLLRALPPGTRAGTDRVRGLATEIATSDSGFTALRAKIHSMPELSDAEAVRRYRPAVATLQPKLDELAEAISDHYSPAGRERSYDSLMATLPSGRLHKSLAQYRKAVSGRGRIRAMAAAVDAAASANRIDRYTRLRVLATLEELAVGDASLLASDALSRDGALELIRHLVRAAQRLGVISAAERADMDATISAMAAGDTADYVTGAGKLRRALEWGAARYRYDLGLALDRYAELEPTAVSAVDDMIRSGILVPLGTIIDRVERDAGQFVTTSHRILGLGARPAVFGQYPGVAVGVLRTALRDRDFKRLKTSDIALVREIPPDLPPVAGIIRIGASESLSHVALLAMNLGIPYAVVSGVTADKLAELDGKEMVLGVSPKNQVLLGPLRDFSRAEREQLLAPSSAKTTAFQLKEVDLSQRFPLDLSEISNADSGTRVGPKAAKLAELFRRFPQNVAPAAVLPFGVFYRHVSQTSGPGPSPLAALASAHRRARKLRPKAADRIILPALAAVRRHILEAPLPLGFERQIAQAVNRLRGDGNAGVFVRSDTNVEDLPLFTGAGLNLTVENQVEDSDIIAAIRRVWASAYSERSYRWRRQFVPDPTAVYPSVILQRSISSEFSGVLVTEDIYGHRKDALTVSVGEGVGAVVGGAPAETLVVLADGTHERLQSARAIVYNSVAPPPAQGLARQYGRAPTRILVPKLLSQLVKLAEQVESSNISTRTTPLDIEFGIKDDHIWLFQMRPLSRNDAPGRHPVLEQLDEGVSVFSAPISLTEVLP